MQQLTVTEELYAKQIQLMQAERQSYAAQVADLLRDPDRHGEVAGYLALIRQINDACISLARVVRYELNSDTVAHELAA